MMKRRRRKRISAVHDHRSVISFPRKGFIGVEESEFDSGAVVADLDGGALRPPVVDHWRHGLFLWLVYAGRLCLQLDSLVGRAPGTQNAAGYFSDALSASRKTCI